MLTTIILVLLLVGAIAFGAWAYSGKQDYKNNTQAKIDSAVDAAKKTQADQLNAQFDQANKSPYKVFSGSPTYGTISFNYPKSWSAYVDTSQDNEPINGYFYPDTVPGIQSKSAFALRVELVQTDYSDVIQQLSNQMQQGNLTARAYTPPKLAGVANVQPGTLFTGAINNQDQTQRGSALIIKVRDKTLEVYTESDSFLPDFNNTILSSLTFAP